MCLLCFLWQILIVHQFVRKLITEWRLELPVADSTVVVAVSGGADSVSLLLALEELTKTGKLKNRIVAAHFNHKLRGAESDADEEYVRKLATKFGIELAVGHSRELKGNVEQSAREARYEFLLTTAINVKAVAVLTAHTVNDQAETFLLNLIRGSGPTGLGGMRVVRHLRNPEEEKRRKGEEEIDAAAPPRLLPSSPVLLIRPLLTWAKRRETEGYCQERGIEYCYDTMNEDTAFKRVRIRKILMPLLEDLNPNIIETLANTAYLMQMNIVAGPPQPVADDSDGLLLADLRTLPQTTLYATLRDWLGQRRGNLRSLELKHIKAIERLVHSEKSGRVAELPGGAHVVKSGGRLRYEENGVDN